MSRNAQGACCPDYKALETSVPRHMCFPNWAARYLAAGRHQTSDVEMLALEENARLRSRRIWPSLPVVSQGGPRASKHWILKPAAKLKMARAIREFRGENFLRKTGRQGKTIWYRNIKTGRGNRHIEAIAPDPNLRNLRSADADRCNPTIALDSRDPTVEK